VIDITTVTVVEDVNKTVIHETVEHEHIEVHTPKVNETNVTVS